MSNSNFTPETLPLFPLSTLLAALQWRVEKGVKGRPGMIGRRRLDLRSRVNTFRKKKQ